MNYRVAADLVALLHFGFVLFVVFGALLALRWPRALWFQVPAALWGIWIEFTGGVCPLTPLENSLRLRGGESGYAGGFVEHYLLPILYPSTLTRSTQFVLGSAVLLVNVLTYWWIARRRRPSGAAFAKEHGGGPDG